ncbi:zinc-binding dehydrogenase [Kutzneria kofuensis]|uniref:NADPH:quinone reductase-like Zn-dependent oxidoreductase n=1 Tax=Kutzneria kofuensis TaxID=103725 RepID=A0A7W9NKG3_9PSEU|nr:zinc-binding dehydrogenase [Kutzneria kofuensis]MBB5895356.1 NADPH:quinone reductase-like Zn-dependent oxidoreductase [Kutzneria kofuensis]
MRAIKASRFGPPNVLELAELPAPQQAAGQFRVDVDLVGVGWLDTRIRSGNGPEFFAVTPPYVPGGAVAGVVTAIGPEVDHSWLGARVITRATGGGYAEVVLAAPEASYVVPAGLELRDALALLDDGSTALALLERTPVRDGDRVLVAPGVGGLGSLLVQLAGAAGATVIAAVRGEEKAAIARKLGAQAVDYSDPDWARTLSDLDVVFDGIGGVLGASFPALLSDGGRFSAYGMAGGAETVVGEADRQRLSVVGMSQLPEFWADTPRRVRQVLDEAAAGRLTPIIGRIYPLEQAAAAHSDIESRRFLGKLLLQT